ncbi:MULTISPECIES: cytochrome P450 [unclassified Modestobacter]|uniref:cytochrome P450 n=1 Tax=unclassified Modestobacter TaxID=2643866 RepID=UPI0022AA7BBB|nr:MULTISPECIES: cytochrome P450 [unclassified Modestobacter]MCZ2825733.1 cytochrome P450 [Modestobacter sp. VKM Ac-2981]MCZ2853202.1 cytochrome P450 [Modestobacter sp. VKM Ac-2982]
MTPAPAPFDLTDAALVADPYPAFAVARAAAPVQWNEQQDIWLAFGHAEANAVLRDRRLGRIWSDRAPAERFESFNLIHRNAILEMEPPTHTRLRRLISAAFARGHVERLRPWVQELADSLVDSLVERSAGETGVDVLSGMAEELPVAVIAELLGVPAADRPLLRPWSNAIVKMYEYGRTTEVEADAERAAAEFVAYLRELAAERRTAPGEDLLTHLVTVRDAEGDRLTEDELVTTCILLLNAGHEATVNVSGNGLLALLEHPDQLDRLRADPALLPTAIEELMRYDSPLQLFERTATSDVEIGGVTIARGQKVAALLGSANRDPAVFADPDTLDVGRTENPHISFGAGVHFCIGAPLARVELQASFGALLSRTSRLELARPARRRPEFVIRGLQDLPVVLTGR